MMSKRALSIVCVCLALGSVLPAQKPGRQLVPKAPDFVEIVNEERPLGPPIEVKFVPDLTLRQEGWTPHALLVSEDGNIHVFSGKNNTMTRFDAGGRETLRRDFKAGQGPGEFGFFDPEFARDGRLLVIDGRQRRLTSFDKDFKVLAMSNLELWGDHFLLDSGSNMYLLTMKFLPKTKDRQLLVLSKLDAAGKLVREFHEYEWGLTLDARSIYHRDAYQRQVKFQLDGRDDLWYVSTDRYEVNVVSPEGLLVRRIVKKGEPRELTGEEIAELRPKDPRSRVVTDIPDRVPPLAGLFLLDGDHVLVVTFESLAEEPELVGDVFDGRGIYRGRTRLPKYDGWDFLMAPSKPAALVRGGYFYTIETPEGGEETLVRRYKIVIS